MDVVVEHQGNAGPGWLVGSAVRSSGPAGSVQVADYGGDRVGLRVTGEVDLNGHQVWEQVLRRVLGQPGDDVHLDLTDLRFIDVRSTEALVRTAGMLSDGRRLVLHHPPPCLRRTLQALWPAGVPAIAIEGDTP